MEIRRMQSELQRNLAAEDENAQYILDISNTVFSTATYSTTYTPKQRNDAAMHVILRINTIPEGVRAKVSASLERSLNENAKIWTELSKY